MSQSSIEKLSYLISKLPGLGSRSARRVVLHLLEYRESIMDPLSKALEEASQNIKSCEICSNLDEISPCSICSSPSRDSSTICVIESVADLWAIERSNIYKGFYQVLGGTLSATDMRRPNDINIEQLVNRVKETTPKEVIIATNATVDGQTTAFYISERMKVFSVKTTRLAYGLPIGGELDYLDEGTLNAALESRKVLEDA